MVKSAAIQAVVAAGAVAVAALGLFGGARLGAVIAPSTARAPGGAAPDRARPERLVRANASVLVLRLHELPHGFAPVPAHTGAVTRAWLAANSSAGWYRTIVGSHLRTEWQTAFQVPQLLDLRDPTPDVDGSLLAIGEVVSVWRDAASARRIFRAPTNPIRRTFASMRLLPAPRIGDETEAAITVTSGIEIVDVHVRIANVTESITVGGLAGALTAARAFDVARLAASPALAAARGGTATGIAAETTMPPRPISPLDLFS
jgi:hypothetical protein